MKPYATKRETKGQVSLTSNCPTRKRALKRDKVAARRTAKAYVVWLWSIGMGPGGRGE